ncbi:MAG: sulfite oxidase [Thermomicrobiales bacterium]
MDHRAPDLVVVRSVPLNAETPYAAFGEPITPVASHYVRSNFPIPEHDGTLSVGGAVGNPLRLDVADLAAMPSVTLPVTMECAGNGRVGMRPLPVGEPWAGTAVGTARWTGVPLTAVLAMAEPSSAAVEVAFTGADRGPYKGGETVHFGRSLDIDRAMDPATPALIATMMNGEPLTISHGAPLRLVVPGWYGMASVKWLDRIEVREAPFDGPYQVRSYVYEWEDGPPEPVSTGKVRALVTDPVPGSEVAPGARTIRGWAWAGGEAVTSVEVSTDGGDVWRPADLGEPVGVWAWRPWSHGWEPAEEGRHVIRARATAATGEVQPDRPRWNRQGYGNNATLAVVIDVRADAGGDDEPV